MSVLPQKLRNKLHSLQSRQERALAEVTGWKRYTMRARDNIDSLLQDRLPSQGTYLEAGALDGFHCSNTYFLDRVKGWKGILVEPNPFEFQQCKKFRKRANCIHAAMVPFDYPDSTVSICYGHDLTWTDGAYENSELESRQQMLERYHLSGQKIDVPARTMQSILDEHQVELTFLSLDVEGFEIQVLNGLDFAKSAPEFMLIEIQNEDRLQMMMEILGDYYGPGEKLTRHDYFFKRR